MSTALLEVRGEAGNVVYRFQGADFAVAITAGVDRISRDADRALADREGAGLGALGERVQLFLVPPELETALRSWSRGSASPTLVVRCDDDALERLPWEILPRALDLPGLLVARVPLVEGPPRPPAEFPAELVASAWLGADREATALSFRRELTGIGALSGERLKVTQLLDATVPRLAEVLGDRHPSLVHLVASHLQGDGSPGALLLGGSTDAPLALDAAGLADLLGSPGPSLVALQTCFGGRTIAPLLASRTRCTVVAWAGWLRASTAEAFSAHLYRCLLDGASAIEAVRTFPERYGVRQGDDSPIPSLWLASFAGADAPVLVSPAPAPVQAPEPAATPAPVKPAVEAAEPSPLRSTFHFENIAAHEAHKIETSPLELDASLYEPFAIPLEETSLLERGETKSSTGHAHPFTSNQKFAAFQQPRQKPVADFFKGIGKVTVTHEAVFSPRPPPAVRVVSPAAPAPAAVAPPAEKAAPPAKKPVTLDLRAVPALCPALLKNGRPIFEVARIRVSEPRRLRLEIVCDTGVNTSVYRAMLDVSPEDGGVPIVALQFPVLYPLIHQSSGRRYVTFTATLSDHSEVLDELTLQSLLLDFNEWVDREDLWAFLPAFVRPQGAGLEDLEARATEVLTTLDEGSNKFDGYQRPEPAASKQIEALYKAIGKRVRVSYAGPLGGRVYVPGARDLPVQLVRLPADIVRTGSATCNDLALLFASFAERVGLYPLVILTADHTFFGVWTTPAAHERYWKARDQVVSSSEAFGDRWTIRAADLKDLVGKVQILVLEATGVTDPEIAGSYSKAVKRAKEGHVDNLDVKAAVDVQRSREAIQPL